MKKMTIAMIAPVLALKPGKSLKAAKPVKPAPAKAKAVKAVKPAKAKGELNTDALEAPYAVKGKPHHYQYK